MLESIRFQIDKALPLMNRRSTHTAQQPDNHIGPVKMLALVTVLWGTKFT